MTPEEEQSLIDAVVPYIEGPNRDLKIQILSEFAKTIQAPLDRLDLKMIASATRELRTAFSIFSPHRQLRKVTIFGSARTPPSDPSYELTYKLAAGLAAREWMVITGGGPGIMDAGVRGASPNNAFGINIKLPFEQLPSDALINNPYLIEMKYFFTRKVLMIKESDAFVALPGGMGTLDETFELLTLLQTGKAQPAPVVLLDPPGTGYWEAFEEFLRRTTLSRGLISEIDLNIYRRSTSIATTIEEITGFYRNFDSIRVVGRQLIIRLRTAPSPARLAALSAAFADILIEGALAAVPATPWEVREQDRLDLERVALAFDNRSFGRLRQLIDALNTYATVPDRD